MLALTSAMTTQPNQFNYTDYDSFKRVNNVHCTASVPGQTQINNHGLRQNPLWRGWEIELRDFFSGFLLFPARPMSPVAVGPGEAPRTETMPWRGWREELRTFSVRDWIGGWPQRFWALPRQKKFKWLGNAFFVALIIALALVNPIGAAFSGIALFVSLSGWVLGQLVGEAFGARNRYKAHQEQQLHMPQNVDDPQNGIDLGHDDEENADVDNEVRK